MKSGFAYIRIASTLSVLGCFAFSACSGPGGGSVTPQSHGSTGQSPQSTSRFLHSATQGTPVTAAFDYVTNPPNQLAWAAGSQPAAFPSPAECVAKYGLVCYTPSEIRAAYNVPANLAGAGQTIVIVDAFGSPTVRNDLHTFDVAMGLSDPTLNIIYPGGQPPPLDPNNHQTASWASETSLDVEWAHAIAPGATIDLVIAANNGGNVLNNAQQYAVDNHLGNVMSLSFGAPEAAINGGGNNTQVTQADAIYQEAQSKGITVFSSSGDFGATDGTSVISANFPASDPLVTAVGGTNLFYDVKLSGAKANGYQGEDVWDDQTDCPFGCKRGVFGATGGAPSIIFAAPSYQQALSGKSARTTSDVGYNASVYTGVLVYMSWGSPGFYFFGGTSSGSPQWAALTALADQSAGRALGFINPKLYAIGANGTKYAADFHDVTAGNNNFNGPGFPAGTGYDIPTGLGTPNAANLITDLTH